MEKPAREHALAVIKAGISTVPVIGGVIASLVGDYIPTATARMTEYALNDLKRRLEELKDRIDTETVNKDEFAELFKSCYLVIFRTHQKEKIRAAAALLANTLLKKDDSDKLSYTELDHFVRCLDAVSIGAIRTLGHAVKIAETKRPGHGVTEPVRLDFTQIHRRMAETDAALLMGLIGELSAFHVLHFESPSVRLPGYRNWPVELTPLGYRFVKRVLMEGA